MLGGSDPVIAVIVSKDLTGTAQAGQSAAEKLGADDGCRHIDTAGLGKPGIASYDSHLISEYHLVEQHSHQDHGDQGDHQTCLDPELAKDLGKLGVVRDGQGAQGTDGGISHGIHHDIDGKEHEDAV